jgi:ribosomal protein S12 methylthiotransferase accessory factor
VSAEAAQARSRVDPSSVTDTTCQALLARYFNAGFDLAIYNSTSDIEIASFICVIRPGQRSSAVHHVPSMGMGCHPSRGIALARALTEAAQTRLTVITGARDDIGRSEYERLHQHDLALRIDARMAATPAFQFEDIPDFEGQLLSEDVAYELGKLDAAGLGSVLMVDLTRPDLAIPVVRVLIPGLEPGLDSPGYIPGVRALAVMNA